jgi:hypothetical protein
MEWKYYERRPTVDTFTSETDAMALGPMLVLDNVHGETSVEPFMISELC